MKHANVLCRNNMYQHAVLHVPDFNETRLKGQDIWIENGKALGSPLPSYHPVLASTPPVPVHKEGVITVTQEELGGYAFDVDRLNVFFALHKVQRSVRLVKQRLSLECFERDYFETSGTANAQLRAEEMQR